MPRGGSDPSLVVRHPVANFKLQDRPLVLRRAVFESTVQNVRSLLVIIEGHVPADRRDLIGKAQTQSPSRDVHLVNALVPQIAVAIGPEPMPVVVEMITSKGPDRRRPSPEIVINPGGYGRSWRVADAVSPLKAQATGQVDLA